WGFPCCVRFPCVHAAATTPVQRLGVVLAHLTQPWQPSPEGVPGRPAHCPFRGLLGVHSRCGLHTRTVTNSGHVNRRLQPLRYLRYLHDCSDCFRLERLPDGICTHWKTPPLHGAHPQRTLARPRQQAVISHLASRPTNPNMGMEDRGGSSFASPIGSLAIPQSHSPQWRRHQPSPPILVTAKRLRNNGAPAAT